jgi:hypothetical protein
VLGLAEIVLLAYHFDIAVDDISGPHCPIVLLDAIGCEKGFENIYVISSYRLFSATENRIFIQTIAFPSIPPDDSLRLVVPVGLIPARLRNFLQSSRNFRPPCLACHDFVSSWEV